MAAPRAALAGLRVLGLGLLGLAALAGLALSAAALWAATPSGRSVVARAAVRILDEQVAGRLELEGIAVLPQGGAQLLGLRVFDPEERLVLAVDRARLFADVTSLSRRELGLAVELDGPAVLLEEDEGGGLSLARAFAPTRPGPVTAPAPEAGAGGPPLTVRVSRLAVRDGSVWWVDAEGETRLEASGVDLDARGLWSEQRAELELRLSGEAATPLAGSVALEVVLAREGSRLSVPLLAARLGGTSVALAGQGDLAARSGRAAVTRYVVDRDQARALAPVSGEGADVEGAAYAESDGRVVTAAIAVAPRKGAAVGRAEVAVAIALDGARALGFDLVADRVSPARLHAAAPDGDVTLAAHGAAEGTSLAALRGRVELSLSPSRLRGGRLGPGRLSARADRGLLRVDRLELGAPGLAVEGAGSWRQGGAVSGKASAEAQDLGAALANAGALLGEQLPRASGRLRLDAALSGTSALPALVARLEAQALQLSGVGGRALKVDAELLGPLEALSGSVAASAASVSAGGGEIARAVRLEGRIADEELRLDLRGAVPALGETPVALAAQGRLGPRRETLLLSALSVTYPPAGRYGLVRPATVRLEGPAVDRLELADGAQRIALEGGLGRRGALDARVEVAALDLARLPAGFLPEGVAGALSLDARATGTTVRPLVDGKVSLGGGAFRNLAGLDGVGELAWDGAARRATATLGLARAKGGLVELEADLPVPLAGRDEPVRVKLRAEGLPVEELLAAARVAAPVEGNASAEVLVEGTTEAPRLRAELGLADAAYEDFFPIAARAAIEGGGERVTLDAEVQLDGRPALALQAAFTVAVDGELVAAPAGALARLRAAPVQATATVPGVELATLAGTLGLPAELAGRVEAVASLEGTLEAPRGAARAALVRGAQAGWRDVSAEVDVRLSAAAVGAVGRVGVGGAELARLDGSLAAAPEQLLEPVGLRRAPLVLEIVVPEGKLARATGEATAFGGSLRGHLAARGTLAAPTIDLTLAGSGVEVEGRPLGDATATARYAAGRTTAAVELLGARTGKARASLELDAPLGIDLDLDSLGERPVELRLVAEGLDLGIAPALAPGIVRSASGRLDADVVARGPLARPSPRGKVTLSDGRLAVSEYGDWTGIRLDVEVTDDAVELRRMEAHRGVGQLEASGALRGLASGKAKLEGKLRSDRLTVMRAGMVLATFDLEAAATGGYAAGRLEVELRVPRGVVRLPDKLPRELQSLEQRADIVIGKPKEPRRRGRLAAVTAGVPGREPLTLVVRFLAPGQLFVKSASPRIDLEVEADVTYERRGGESYAEGSVEVIRGTVEPIGGRTFQVERGRVQFTGGPPAAALLDVQARYDNPAAKVIVNITGPALDPQIRLSSQPPMDDAQIAMLIATGRTDLKAGAGGVGSVTGEEAGRAAISVFATQVFKDLVADKLPLDTVALDSGALRAGKYVTDKIYVGYTRRFEANVEKGENSDEVRVEYQISPRWTFESRYGNAQSGGASLIWSRDY